ncbi:hypothetical protein GCM10025794_32040 [Massilia kyonggiensis]
MFVLPSFLPGVDLLLGDGDLRNFCRRECEGGERRSDLEKGGVAGADFSFFKEEGVREILEILRASD